MMSDKSTNCCRMNRIMILGVEIWIKLCLANETVINQRPFKNEPLPNFRHGTTTTTTTTTTITTEKFVEYSRESEDGVVER
ncbi:hypothetical protein M0802_011802 [Mischocyttarus mexicanus]|nr:hypothetical protein M0802_011802 [Mischocyttarus mexicanus]